MAKPSSPSKRISAIIRERGPLTVAAFMDLALYDSRIGYYARAAQRSGRAGDFFTSVDVGPLFGELLGIQIAEMADILDGRGNGVGAELARPFDSPVARSDRVEADPARPRRFDLVEAGAGNGRLAADILRAARRRHAGFYERIRLHLVEASAAARAAQPATLHDVTERLVSSSDNLPLRFDGALVANELLDALPVHQVVMREDGLREVYVDSDAGCHLAVREGPPSTPALAEHLLRVGVALEPGWRAEINLRAVEWIREAARRLGRGFIIIIDYGHEARELYSIAHAEGTLTTYAGHTLAEPEHSPRAAAWLEDPGERDLTAHVDFTSIRLAAEAEGLTTLGFTDQTYFLLGLLESEHLRPRGAEAPRQREFAPMEPVKKSDVGAELAPPSADQGRPLRDFFTGSRAGRSISRQLKTLLMPGGLGSTHKVMIFGKDVGTPALCGCSFRIRIT